MVQHHFPQLWFLLISVMAFGLYVALDLRLFSIVLDLDRSYMASLTMGLVILATFHCGWHIAHFSSRIQHLQSWLNERHGKKAVAATAIPHPFLQAYLSDLDSSRRQGEWPASDEGITDILAEQFRSPADLGWFFVDLAVRLGLLGTIIGFILIFASLTDINIEGGDDLKNLLIAMSGGMGTALLTTLTGLIAASILSFQYLILGRETEHLIGLLQRVKAAHLSS